MDKKELTQIVADTVRGELEQRAETDKTALTQLIEDRVVDKESLDKLIKEAVYAEMAQRKWVYPATTPVPEVEKGLRFARFVCGMVKHKGDSEKALDYVTSVYGEPKALGGADFEAGGAIVPPEYSAEIIELLRAQAVVRALGAQAVPMNSGTMTMPRQTTGGTAYYIGENVNIPKSEQRFGQLSLSAKKLAALTPVSNDLIRDASPAVDVVVRNDLIAAMSLREDLAFIRDDGTENKPQGLRYWANPSNVFAANTTVNLANVTADLTKALRLIEEGNVPLLRMGWIFTPRTKGFLMSLRDANGNFAFRPEMLDGTLMTYPYRITTQIPNNLGSGSDESEVYLADFAQAVIGENTQLIVGIYEGGTYHDGTTIISGISADQTIVRTLARHDFVVRHDRAVSVITGVKWM